MDDEPTTASGYAQGKVNRLVDHFFRHESGKLVAVLTRIFGPHNLELAEDVVQDALTEAIDHWRYKGIPDNPAGWIYKVAKNRALNILNREKYKRKYSEEVAHLLQSEWTAGPSIDHLFSEREIMDDQLRMIFTCCHPSITTDSQVALTLKTLCGFSISEIAKAFLTTEDTTNKRLVRARQKIREADIPFAVPQEKELEERLGSVLEVIYLLFNEGYSASVGDDLIRDDLCMEAIRLAELLTEHQALKNISKIYALLSLMYLNTSRFPARQNEEGHIIPLPEQDRSLWNKPLMNKGFSYVEKSTSDGKLSIYHILAAISANHCAATDDRSTNWENILTLYDHLLHFDYSPLVILNRAVALSKVKGVPAAIAELRQVQDEPAFRSYYLFYSTLAELYMEQKSFDKAVHHLMKAIALSPVQPEKELLKKRLGWCQEQLC